MEIEVNEKYAYLVMGIALFLFCIDASTPIPDNYWFYYVAKATISEPSIMISNISPDKIGVLTSNVHNLPYFNYPPIMISLYMIAILANMAPTLIIHISMLIILFFTYKTEHKSIPFLFMSFIFLRSSVQGGNDILIAMLTMLSIYTFNKNIHMSAIFASMSFLSKPTGILTMLWFAAATVLFNRSKKGMSAIFIMILISTPWLIRNYLVAGNDIISMITGQNISTFQSAEKFLRQGIQATAPEINFIDTTWFYPNPVDNLLVIGMIALPIDIYRRRKLDKITLMPCITLLAYFTMQTMNIRSLMPIRYYMMSFPVFAIIAGRNLPPRYLKHVTIAAIIISFIYCYFFIWEWSFATAYISSEVCPNIKNTVHEDPTYIEHFHQFFLAYTCNINFTNKQHAKYLVRYTLDNNLSIFIKQTGNMTYNVTYNINNLTTTQ